MTTLIGLLADCERRGVGVRLEPDGRVLLTGEVDRLPGPTREALRTRKPELVRYLTESARPAPAWVPFVARTLAVAEIPYPLVATVPGVWFGDRLHYRAAPPVVAWLAVAVDRLWVDARTRNDAAAVLGAINAAGVVTGLQRWVDAHYPPHLVLAAHRSGGSLPDVQKPPD